jgi:glycosyltransferase involved in cell wall biosynthesis
VPVLFNIQSAYHAGLAADAPYHLRVPDTYSLLRFVPEGAKTAQPTPLELLKSDFARLLQQAATRRGIQKAKLFVTNTRALREEMEALYGRGAEVIYLGGFGAPSTSSPERSANTIELLTVSRLQSSKRIHWILQSLAHIVKDAKKAIPWHLHIVGNGPDGEALKLQAQQLGLADRVQFHGFVSDSDLKALYSKSHVFLMPGKQGYGLPAIEALYQKMGLVLSDESGVVEILGNTNWVAVAHGGQTGFQAALADMMMRVAKPDFVTQPLPELPLEKTWAEKVIQYFKWQ